jgi:hypothetical protein
MGVRGTQEYTRVLKSLLYSLLNHHLIISLGRVLRGLEVGRGVALRGHGVEDVSGECFDPRSYVERPGVVGSKLKAGLSDDGPLEDRQERQDHDGHRGVLGCAST